MQPNQNQPAQYPPQAPQPYAQPPQNPYPPQPAPAQPQVAQAPKSNPNSTQNSLQIAEIRDGLVVMEDGSYRAVILAQSINFDLMSDQEREGVEQSYQGFLNSLYFPVQIMMRSVRVDLKGYMSKLEKQLKNQDNVLLSILMEDYINYITYLSETANIMDKQFYIVIPYFPSPDMQQAIANAKKLGSLFKKKKQVITINENDFAKAKAEITQRVQSAVESLTQMGIQSVPLSTQELIELYYNVYNPDTATAQQLGNFHDLEADVVTRGSGPSPNVGGVNG